MVHVRRPHLLFVSQKVVDIKLALDLPDLAIEVGGLREFLQRHAFIPGDKCTGELTITRMDKNGSMICELTGGSLGSSANSLRVAIRLTLPLGLRDYSGDLRMRDVFCATAGTSVEAGGNVQNMLLDTVVLAEGLSRQYEHINSDNLVMTIATSSDPCDILDCEVAGLVRKWVSVYLLGIPDRFAVHLPYEHAGRQGIMAITSEPMLTYESLLNLLRDDAEFARAFRTATCFVSSDPFFQILPNHALAPYTYVINSSTALRALVAVSAYGTNALLPMNQGEAGEVCKLMLSRARGTELDQTETPRFPSPLTINEKTIDPTLLKILDGSIDMFARYNPFYQQAEGFSFTCPISFGPDGGLIVCMNRAPLACFTSVLSEEGEDHLFRQYSFPKAGQVQETGAGDAVAAVVTLFNVINPDHLIDPHLEGKEKRNEAFRQVACTLFVSCLSRIVGNLLVRTSRTNLTHLAIDQIGELIVEAAERSVGLARECTRLLPDPVFGVVKEWGIKTVMWVPRRILAPSEVPVAIANQTQGLAPG